MADKTAQIDANIEIVTPENIAFRYQVAGPFRRFPAFLLDMVIRAAIFFALAILLGMAGALAALGAIVQAMMIILWFLLEWFYGGVFETMMNGQTPGKWVMGIRVLSTDGEPITGIQAIMRNLIRFVDMWPLVSVEIVGAPFAAYVFPTFMLSLVTMAMNKRFQRIGDLVCGTIVVVEERHWLTGVAKLEDPRIAQLANYIPTDFQVTRSLARTLAAYVDRRRFFSFERRREVARHLAEPLLAKFGFPDDTSYDLLLCALYYRTFIADRTDEDEIDAKFGETPFGQAAGSQVDAPAVIQPVDQG